MSNCEYCGAETDSGPLAQMPGNVITEFIGWYCSNCRAGEFHPLYNAEEFRRRFPDGTFLPNTTLYVRPWDH